MKKNYLSLILLICALNFGFGQTYNQITSLAELTDGNYLIVGDGTTNDGLMTNSTAGSVYIDYNAITNPGATITTGYTNNNVFNINVSGGVITIYNPSVGYVSWGRTGATGNDADFYNGTIADTERWTPTVNSGLWSLANVDDSSRVLQWNNSAPRFVAYTSSQVELKLYKEASSTLTINVSPSSLTGMDYVIGNGPSTPSATFSVSGSNLTNNIILTPPTNYEISLDNSTWISNPLFITLNQSAGSVNPTTLYVRLVAGLTIGNYNLEDISITSSGATNANVTCNGSVTGSNNSDIIAVAASESAIISSTINDTAPLTSTQGVQVWQITVRDGGASAPDADNLSTILTDLTFAQAAGNQVTTWTDAIESIALFDGTTRVATGNVTANQIQFTGMNVDVADDTQTTLTVRLSLQCPLGADAFDNEDFGFSLSNANTTFSPSGSGKATFPAVTSANGQNRIDVSATELSFTSNPTTTGINSPMIDVVVAALDNCGNIDTDFTGTVSLTSTGTMTGSPLTLPMTSGQATFTGIVHTAVATNRTMTATATGVINATSFLFDITNVTTLIPGDLAILAVNTDYDSSGSNSGDRISFVLFKDITVNTEIYLTDNGYERRYANHWGSSEGVIRIRRTGSTLPAGTIITIEANNTGNITDGSHFDVYTCGVVDTNWNKWALSGAGVGGFNMNNDDDLWFMQGGTWSNSANTGSGSACSGVTTDPWHTSLYSGNVLYGWTESGWDTGAGGCSGNTQYSTLYPQLECFNTIAPLSSGKVKFDDPVDPDFTTSTNGRIDWIALINDTANWNTYADNTDYDDVSLGYDYKLNTTCSPVIIAASSYVNGKWTGRADTNWFYCANWDTFSVPDETVDVLIENHPTYNNHANIDATATYADNYGNVAKTRNLTITGDKVEVSGNINNILEVNRNLYIDTNGALDMDDGNNATTDGQLFISGNWTNIPGETAFDEGNGTVIFNGTAIQNITYGGPPIPPPPFESEIFYNVILDNDFDIATTDRTFIMSGNLTINSGRTLNIQSNQFIEVGNVVTNSGNFTLEDSASLIQVNDVNNVGNLTMNRNYNVDSSYDYVYWSSPITNFSTDDLPTNNNHIYRWNPTAPNTGTGQGNWESATSQIMQEGVGYIARVPSAIPATQVFQNGVPNNGDVNLNLSRGTNAANDDDDWNLVGNPYPSSISAMEFLTANTNLDGFVNIWTHGSDPSIVEPDPFYEDFVYNYDADDYITHNGTATTSGPAGFTGYIAAGQAFMVNTIDGTASSTIAMSFNNSMRQRDYDNSDFYRSNPLLTGKHRIWLDFGLSDETIGERIVVGYVPNATMDEDRLYDAKWIGDETEQRFYSILNENDYLIQGRALPFSNGDVVPVGFNAITESNYTIAVYAVDGLFSESEQDIFLRDYDLGIVHNLSISPYSFNSEIGEFNNRFEIVFTPEALSVNDNTITANDIIITELNNGEVQITVSEQYTIEHVEILDVLGRQVYRLNGNSSTEVYDLSKLSKAAYIAKVTLSNGQVISKKAIKQR